MSLSPKYTHQDWFSLSLIYMPTMQTPTAKLVSSGILIV